MTLPPATPHMPSEGGNLHRPHRRAAAGRRRVVLAFMVCVIPALAFLGSRLVVPSDGAHLRPGSDGVRSGGLVLSPLDPSSGPLREGDLLVAIDGVPVETLARGLLDPAARSSRAAAVAVPAPGWRHGAVVRYDLLRDGEPHRVEVPLGGYPLWQVVARTWGTILFALVSLLVASVVFLRRPDHPPARVLFVGAGALLGSTTWSLGLQASDFVFGPGLWLYGATSVVVFMTYWTCVFHFATVFPTPLPFARRRPFVAAVYLGPLLVLAVYGSFLWSRVEGALDRIAELVPTSGYHAAVFLALALAAVVRQYRRHPAGATRQQIRWVVLAALVAGGAGLFLYILPPLAGMAAVHPNFIGAIVTVFPVALAVAVLRHNLFDIDTLIQRALVYGALTFTVAAAYVAVVAGFGAVLESRQGLAPSLLAPSLLATALVAVAFQPLRERIQRGVNRLIYGERDDPAGVLARLGERLEGTLAPGEVLPTLVETVAGALRLPYVALTVHGSGGPRTVAEFGRSKAPAHRFPLVYRGEPVGELAVEPRTGDDTFTSAERALLATIARQAGVSAYAVRTADDLRRSRERLVAAREEERRRLRRDLHDGLGPALASLTLKLDAASNVLHRDAGAARTLLQELREQVQGAIGDLRVVVHALRPPALDDLGLAAALREQALRYQHDGLTVDVRAPASMPPVPAAVEVASYRIVQEALANVVRHARARRCWLTLEASDRLTVTVEDDGIGLRRDPAPSSGRAGSRGHDAAGSGVGLASMRDRAAELGGSLRIAPRPGGGTRLVAHLPLDPGTTADAAHGRGTTEPVAPSPGSDASGRNRP